MFTNPLIKLIYVAVLIGIVVCAFGLFISYSNTSVNVSESPTVTAVATVIPTPAAVVVSEQHTNTILCTLTQSCK